MKKVSMECPEVNGAICALEENVEDEIMTQEEAEAAFAEWSQAHIADGCPVCSKKRVRKELTQAEKGLARWIADKLATEAKLPKYVRGEIRGMGFDSEPHPAFRVTLRQVLEDGTEKEVTFRFVPEVEES